MSSWDAMYPNDYGEFEIKFTSKEKEKTKAVEKICCAIMDKKVSTPDDVQIVRHGKWIEASEKKGVNIGKKCSLCGARIKNSEYFNGNHKYCHKCGAKMDGD